MSKVLDTVICFDRYFILGCGTLVLSMLKHNPNIKFVFHLCVPQCDVEIVRSEIILRIERLYSKKYCTFEITAFESLDGYKYLSSFLNKRRAAQCARLLIGEIKNYSSNRILFIDSDVICVSNIDLIFNLQFEHHSVIAATKGESSNKIVCGHNCNGYYWAGLLIVDIDKWKNEDIGKKCIDFILKYNPVYQDQDAINVVLNNRITEIDFNWHYMWNYVDETAFIHFPSSKPWEPWGYRKHPEISNIFRRYAKDFQPDVTKWITFKKSKDALINFNCYKARFALKWLAWLFYRKRNYKAFLYFYLKHLRVKIAQKGILGTLLFKSNTRS